MQPSIRNDLVALSNRRHGKHSTIQKPQSKQLIIRLISISALRSEIFQNRIGIMVWGLSRGGAAFFGGVGVLFCSFPGSGFLLEMGRELDFRCQIRLYSGVCVLGLGGSVVRI